MTPAPAEAKSPSPLISNRAWLGLLLASVLLLYYRTIHYPFFFDDWVVIVFNPRLQDWREIPGYFSKHFWYHATGEFRAQYYRPLYLLWFYFGYHLFGVNPAGWRLAALLLHCVNVWLVFRVAKDWLLDQRAALIAAAIFALHPVHIESLGWISGTDNPLAAVAVLCALLAFLRWSRDRRTIWLWICAAAYLVMLLLKELTAVFPLFVLAFAFAQRSATAKERTWNAIKTAAAFVPSALIYLLLRVHALHGAKLEIKASEFSALLTVPSALWFYFQHLLLPIRLTFFNNLAYVSKASSAAFLLPLLAVAVVFATVALSKQKQLQLAFIWILVFLLLPIFGLWIFGESMLVQDRYLYLPAVGFALIVGGLWKLLAARASSPVLANALAVFLLAGYAIATATQVTQWSSEEALYQRGLEIHPDSVIPRSGIAVVHMERAEYSQAETMLRQLHVENPNDAELEWKLGLALYLQKRYAETIPLWQHVIAKAPVSAFHDSFLARACFEAGDFQQGVKMMNDALAVTPEDTSLRLELAARYLEAGDRSAALSHYRAVLARHPEEKSLQDYVRRLESAPTPAKGVPAH